MISKTCGMIGGIERYMADMTKLFREHSYTVEGFFSEKSDDSSNFADLFDKIHIKTSSTAVHHQLEEIKAEGISVVIVHKLMDCKILRALIDIFPTTIAVIHDHDYYCMRHHKYFPYKRINCKYPFSIIRCALCSGMITKRPGSFSPIALDSPFLYVRRLSLLKQFSKVFVLSDYMKQNMLSNGFGSDKIEKIYPVIKIPTNTKKENLNSDNSQIKLLFAGQIIRGKGLDILLHALTEVKSDYILRIVGRGNDTEFIKELICELRIDDKVDFKGFSEDMDVDYSWADVVVVPSRWQEPFGLVGVEAFARKLPVIGFDVGGISEWLKNGVNGVLVEAGNYKKMAEAIDELAENCEFRNRLGEKGYEFVKGECSEGKYLTNFKKILIGKT